MSVPMTSALPDPRYQPVFYDGVPAKRLFAWVIDVVLITVLTVLLGFFTLGLAWLFFFVFYVAMSFTYRWLTIAGGSATVGMRVMNLQLRGPTGARLAPGEAALHTLAYMVCAAFALPQILSIVLMITGPRHQGLHDLLLGTAAINRPR